MTPTNARKNSLWIPLLNVRSISNMATYVPSAHSMASDQREDWALEILRENRSECEKDMCQKSSPHEYPSDSVAQPSERINSTLTVSAVASGTSAGSLVESEAAASTALSLGIPSTPFNNSTPPSHPDLLTTSSLPKPLAPISPIQEENYRKDRTKPQKTNTQSVNSKQILKSNENFTFFPQPSLPSGIHNSTVDISQNLPKLVSKKPRLPGRRKKCCQAISKESLPKSSKGNEPQSMVPPSLSLQLPQISTNSRHSSKLKKEQVVRPGLRRTSSLGKGWIQDRSLIPTPLSLPKLKKAQLCITPLERCPIFQEIIGRLSLEEAKKLPIYIGRRLHISSTCDIAECFHEQLPIGKTRQGRFGRSKIISTPKKVGGRDSSVSSSSSSSSRPLSLAFEIEGYNNGKVVEEFCVSEVQSTREISELRVSENKLGSSEVNSEQLDSDDRTLVEKDSGELKLLIKEELGILEGTPQQSTKNEGIKDEVKVLGIAPSATLSKNLKPNLNFKEDPASEGSALEELSETEDVHQAISMLVNESCNLSAVADVSRVAMCSQEATENIEHLDNCLLLNRNCNLPDAAVATRIASSPQEIVQKEETSSKKESIPTDGHQDISLFLNEVRILPAVAITDVARFALCTKEIVEKEDLLNKLHGDTKVTRSEDFCFWSKGIDHSTFLRNLLSEPPAVTRLSAASQIETVFQEEYGPMSVKEHVDRLGSCKILPTSGPLLPNPPIYTARGNPCIRTHFSTHSLPIVSSRVKNNYT